MYSQLLDLLLDLNSSYQVPHSLRYNLSKPRQLDGPYDAFDLEQANSEVANAYALVQKGEFPQSLYLQYRASVEEALARQHAQRLSDMETTIPHPVPLDSEAASTTTGEDTLAEEMPEYLTSAHQDQYLLALDAKLGDQWSLRQTRPKPPLKFTDLTPRELEREMELRNPFSVHNWLKKHNPTAAIADDASEAGAATTPANKRGRGNNLAKKVGDRAVDRARDREKERDDGAASPASMRGGDIDTLDYDLEEPTSAAKGKKLSEKDDTYRPKGGRSTKAKRKRDTTDENGGQVKGKKARISLASAASATPKS